MTMTPTTHIVFVIDKSGSMSGLRRETIDGFNKFVAEQRKLENAKALLTLVLFDTKYKVVHNAVDLDDVTDLTDKTYQPGGGTALLDAMGRAIDTVRNHDNTADHKVMFAVITDGHENMSREYTGKRIPIMVKECQEKFEWEFVYLGADVDAFDIHEQTGIKIDTIAPSLLRGRVGDNMRSFGALHKMSSEYRTKGTYDVGNTVQMSCDAAWASGAADIDTANAAEPAASKKEEEDTK